jgi:hypothetical protein
LTANQDGVGSTFNAAAPVSQSFNITQGAAVIKAATNFVATLTAANQVTFGWTDNSNGETAYKINRKIGNATATQPVTTGAFNGVGSAVLNGTLTRGIYTFSTTVYNGNTAGPVSNTSVIDLSVTPRAITGFTATAGAKSVTLVWNGANNVTSYTVQTRTVTTQRVRGRTVTTYGNWTNVSTAIAPNATSYTATGLTTGSVRQFQISATNPAGTTANVTTGNVTVK